MPKEPPLWESNRRKVWVGLMACFEIAIDGLSNMVMGEMNCYLGGTQIWWGSVSEVLYCGHRHWSS